MGASRIVLSALALLVAANIAAEAAQAIKPLEPSPDHPGKCFDPDLQLVLAPGEKQQAEGKCLVYNCGASSTGFQLIYNTCGSVAAGGGCVLEEQDPALPYPDCCPKPKC